MTKVIVFCWNSNTWKTSALAYIGWTYAKRYPDKKILILEESARKYINLQDDTSVVNDVHEFERFVTDHERERLHELKRIVEEWRYDCVCIDRSMVDCLIYSYRNMINGALDRIDYVKWYHDLVMQSREIYSNVVYFTTPIKEDNRFPIYNNEHINAIFQHTIQYIYWEKVLTYSNNIEFQALLEWSLFDEILS